MPEVTGDNNTRKEIYWNQLAELKLQYQPYRQHQREIEEYIEPRSGANLASGAERREDNRGSKVNTKVINCSPSLHLSACRSGLMAGMSNPMSHWFRLTSWDDEILSWEPARRWLYDAEQYSYHILDHSDAYESFGNIYEDCPLYGLGANGSFNDPEDGGLYFEDYPVGTFYFTQDHKREVNGFFYEYELSCRNLIRQFGRENCSDSVRDSYDKHHVSSMFPVIWVVEKNYDRRNDRYDVKNRPWKSCRFEPGDKDNRILEDSGYFELPVSVARWTRKTPDLYPMKWPGAQALGDSRAIQKMEDTKLKQLEYRLTPPMRAPAELSFKPNSLLPRHISYYHQAAQSGVKFEPLYQVTTSIDDIRQEIMEHVQRVSRAFYADLWQMLASMDHAGLDRERTATEIAARQQEKILNLAPVLYSFSHDLHRPTIMRNIRRGIRLGHLRPPPDELLQAGVKLDFVSILAQAHALVQAGSIERFNNYVAGVTELSGRPTNVVDWDAQIRKYAELTNQPPEAIRDQVAVERIEEQQLAQQQATARLAIAQQGAEAAKTLSQAEVSPDNAFGQLMGQAGAGESIAAATQGA